MLFFFAGYEIDFERIRGRPMQLAGLGWALSLVLAYGIGGALAAAGVIVSYLYTGSAMATTAIGTLIPILSDAADRADLSRPRASSPYGSRWSSSSGWSRSRLNSASTCCSADSWRE
jgi:hypothetical protein